MFKKLCYVIILAIIVSLFSVPAFAAGGVLDPDTPQTEQFILTITRPENNESTYNKFYEICGITDKENVTVEFYIKDKTEGVYKRLPDVTGKSSWTNIGVFFAKEVELKEGANEIRIVAYTKTSPNKVQISDFKIQLLEKGFLNMLKDKFQDLQDMLKRTKKLPFFE